MQENIRENIEKWKEAENDDKEPDQKKYLFYYEEAINAWTPVVSVECMVSLDEFDNDEDEKEIKFRCFWMTDEEYKSMPTD